MQQKTDVYKRQVLTNEENQFNKTIDQGLRILSDMEEDMKKAGEKTLSGDNAFKLYDTYGFPLDLTKEILEEKGYGIDEEGFQKAMEEQRVDVYKRQLPTVWPVRYREEGQYSRSVPLKQEHFPQVPGYRQGVPHPKNAPVYVCRIHGQSPEAEAY